MTVADFANQNVNHFSFSEDLSSETKSALLKQLLWDYESILYQYKVKLVPPAIQLSSSNSVLGYWKKSERIIGISEHLIARGNWKLVLEILKHEIAHQIADEIYGGHSGHDEVFQKACERIFVEHWARGASIEVDGKLPDIKQISEGSNQSSPVERKIEKLLNLAESSNENEALLALEKAKQLREKYNLELLKPYKKSDYYSLTIETKKKRLDNSYSYLVKILTMHFGVKSIFSSLFCPLKLTEYKTIELIGTAKDLVISEYIYNYLQRSLESLWTSRKKSGGSSDLRSRNSFRLGVLAGFFEKLEAANKKNTQKSIFSRVFQKQDKTGAEKAEKAEKKEESALITLQNLEVQNEYYRCKYPRISRTSSTYSNGNSSAYAAGKREGHKMNISRAISSQGEARLLQ